MYDVTYPVSRSVIQDAAYFEWFSTVVKHAELDLNSTTQLKFQVSEKWKASQIRKSTGDL